MTKAKSKPCAKCACWDGACSKGHKPRFFRDGGLRRVCDDYQTAKLDPAPEMWCKRIMKMFGIGGGK